MIKLLKSPNETLQNEITKSGYYYTKFQIEAILSARVLKGTLAFPISRLMSAIIDSELPQ